MEPLRVFTMEMSWGGWKAVSGLKAIRLGSWLMTDHMAALEPNFSRNSTEDPMLGLSVVTNNRAEMSWGLLDTPLWEEVSHEEMWSWDTQHTPTKFILYLNNGSAGKNIISCPEITHFYHLLAFLGYVLFLWCISWLWCRFWYVLLLICMSGCLYWMCIGTTGITINSGADFGDLGRPQKV